MVTVDTIARVRRAYFVQGRKIKAIARDLRLARNTVRDIVRAGSDGAEQTERRYVRKEQPLPQLGAGIDPDGPLPNPRGLDVRVLPAAEDGVPSGGRLREIMPS